MNYYYLLNLYAAQLLVTLDSLQIVKNIKNKKAMQNKKRNKGGRDNKTRWEQRKGRKSGNFNHACQRPGQRARSVGPFETLVVVLHTYY